MRRGGLPSNTASVDSQQPTPQETHSVRGEWLRGFDWVSGSQVLTNRKVQPFLLFLLKCLLPHETKCKTMLTITFKLLFQISHYGVHPKPIQCCVSVTSQ